MIGSFLCADLVGGVLCLGAFDLLHAGHVAHLEAARGMGTPLIVGLTTDAWVTRHKGPGRPLQPLEDRQRVLLALRWVDAVVASDADDGVGLIQALRPAVYVKGADYQAGDPSGRLDRELLALAEVGGAMVYTAQTLTRSSTAILQGWAAQTRP